MPYRRSVVRNSSNCRGNVALSAILTLVLSSAVLTWAKTELRLVHEEIRSKAIDNPLYLPDAKYVRLITLGFNTFASRILWFNTVNYFGKQFEESRDFKWLGHMCDLVTKLDPQTKHTFEFCGTLLSWMAKEPEESNKILTRAIEHQPHVWRFRYLRGFNYWYFLARKDLAKEEFVAASRLPNAPPFLASLASRLMVDEDSPGTAIAFLSDLIKNTGNDNVKKALEEKLKLAFLSKHKRDLAHAVDHFKKRYGKKPASLLQLVEEKIIDKIPKEPFGGKYSINHKTGEIVTSSGKKGLKFFGKTAETGVFSQF